MKQLCLYRSAEQFDVLTFKVGSVLCVQRGHGEGVEIAQSDGNPWKNFTNLLTTLAYAECNHHFSPIYPPPLLLKIYFS